MSQQQDNILSATALVRAILKDDSPAARATLAAALDLQDPAALLRLVRAAYQRHGQAHVEGLLRSTPRRAAFVEAFRAAWAAR